MGLLQRVKGAFTRMTANAKIAHEFKDIFEVGGVPAFNQFYNFGIFVWKSLYRGMYAPWHIVPAPSIANPNGRREMARINLAKAACAELAGLVWSESCDVNVTREGWTPSEAEPTDALSDYVNFVLKKNGFWQKMQEAVEQCLALGGGALKVWFEPRLDEEGKPKPTLRDGMQRVDSDGYAIPDGDIKIGYCMADQVVPTAWDNAEVTEAVFIERKAKDGYYYTRLEWHKWHGETYVIDNELYRSEMKGLSSNQDILGVRYPLAAVYPFLDEHTEIKGPEKSLFSYFRVPVANNIDDNSPLGISIYANALDTLKSLDICYDSFIREFTLGKKRIIVPARTIKTVIDPQTNQPRRYFDAADEVYEALSTEDPDTLKITDNSVELRVDEHISAINAFLSILCLQLGFSASTFTFDKTNGLKTATEVISENSKTYKTVKTMQEQLRAAITRLVENILTVAALYGVEHDGKSLSELISNGYSVNVQFDDAVVQDRQTNINEGIMLVSNGLMSKTRFLTDPKFGQGLTREQAEAELKLIKDEDTIDAVALDRFNTYSEG